MASSRTRPVGAAVSMPDRRVSVYARPAPGWSASSVKGAVTIGTSGEGGIRTLERGQPPLHDFQSCPFNRSGTSPGATGSLDRPAPVPKDGDLVPILADAVDLHFRRTDHEVGVDLRDVAALAVLVGADREGVVRAERHVRGGVLVEERVVEDGAERADPARAVDERDLAEPAAARVLVGERVQRLG